MFTGIIEAVGTIAAIKHHAQDLTISVDSGELDLSDVKLGDSIAHNGVCLTVTKLNAQGFDADLSYETLKRSGFAQIKTGFAVNLEKAMQMNARFGGHIVSGHVDGVGEITSITKLGSAVEYWVKAPNELAKYIAEKGLAREGAPALVKFITTLASRFGIIVSEKAAAQSIPLIGATGGALINTIFIDHFQNVARGHFIVRRLERVYGKELVKQEYDKLDT